MVPLQFRSKSSKSRGRLQPLRRKRNRALFFEALQTRHLLAGDWQNPLFELDVNDDAFISPIDVLVVINTLNAIGARKLTEPFDNGSPTAAYLDVNSDGSVDPADALALINYLNQTAQPLAVSLALANDSGKSATDRVTNDSRVHGHVALGGAAITAARLRVNREDVIPLTLDAEGRFEIDPRLLSTFTEGAAKVGVFLSDANGALALTGLWLTLDVTPPLSPTVTGFSADSGVLGDGITTDDTLLITGVGQPGIPVNVLFNGSSQGTVTAATDGVWSFEAASKDDGYYAISAVSEDTAGNTSTASGPLVVKIASGFLRGAGDDPANLHIPDLSIDDPPLEDLVAPQGIPISVRDLLVNFRDEATVGEVHALLHSVGAQVSGGLPAGKLLLLRLVGDSDLTRILNAQATLLASPIVAAASINMGMSDEQLPPHNVDPTNNRWTWELPADGGSGNWGLKSIRMPQAWNLVDYARRANKNIDVALLEADETPATIDATDNSAVSAIHPDLRPRVNTQAGTVSSEHATMVAGFIGAIWDNNTGVEGVHPTYLDIVSRGATFLGTLEKSIIGVLTSASPLNVQVVNYSAGFSAGYAKNGIDPVVTPVNPGPAGPGNPTHRTQTDNSANQFLTYIRNWETGPTGRSKFLVFGSAGNSRMRFGTALDYQARDNSWIDNVAARWANPDPAAPLPNGGASGDHFVAVEAMDALGNRSTFSAAGGTVSAPGTSVRSTSTTPSNYATQNGTSFSTPHVTGLAAYLWSLDSSLSHQDVRELLTNPDYLVAVAAGPKGGSVGAEHIDAFASVMGIDMIQGNKKIQEALVDVDDGTADGNLRVDPLEEVDVFDVLTSGHRRGDGRITMRDFRAWRDAYLQVHGGDFLVPAGLVIALDGSTEHFKKDLNFDGSINGQPAAPAHPRDVPVPNNSSNDPGEDVYPRYDFNGDGQLLDWFTTAPFKIDPDTDPPASGINNRTFDLKSSPGFLRDIDVLADPAFWKYVETDGYVEAVTLFPDLEGVNPGSASSWNEWTYLLGNRDADLAGVPEVLRITPDYLHSFDLHVEIDWTAVYPDQDIALIRIESEIQGDDYQQVFTREARITRDEDGTSTFVVTIPVWTGHVRIRTAGFDKDSGAAPPNLDSRPPIAEWTDVLIGQDRALKLPAWQVVDLGTLGGPSSGATAINESGVVVGTSSIDDEFDHAFIYRDDKMSDIHPGGQYSTAQDINDRGVPLISFDSQPDGLGIFTPAALNNSGQMAGTFSVMQNGFWKGHAALSSGGAVLDLQVLAGLGSDWTSQASELNDHGDVVGTLYFHDPNFNRTDIIPFLYSNGVVTQLLGAGSYGAVDINDAGQVIGSIEAWGYHAALWDNGVLTDLGTFGTWRTFAFAINNNGTAVGYSWSGPGPNSRFAAWIKTPSGRLTKLDNLLNDPHWQFQFADDINDRGEIVGSGIINGKHHAFLRRRSL